MRRVFLFAYFKFSASAGHAAVTGGDDLGGLGDIPQQAFGRYYSAKNAKHVHVCIACQVCPELDITIANVFTIQIKTIMSNINILLAIPMVEITESFLTT